AWTLPEGPLSVIFSARSGWLYQSRSARSLYPWLTSTLYAFSLKSGRPLSRKFWATHGACSIALRNSVNRSLCWEALTICSPSIQPTTPSLGVASLTVGPPAALTRKSVPRFSSAIHAEPSASARTESEFWETSLRNAGLADLRKSCARDISAVVMPYGSLGPVAGPAVRLRSVGWFS